MSSKVLCSFLKRIITSFSTACCWDEVPHFDEAIKNCNRVKPQSKSRNSTEPPPGLFDGFLLLPTMFDGFLQMGSTFFFWYKNTRKLCFFRIWWQNGLVLLLCIIPDLSRFQFASLWAKDEAVAEVVAEFHHRALKVYPVAELQRQGCGVSGWEKKSG